MNLQLLGDRILARLIEQDTSDGGVALPACANQSATQRMAHIVNVGPGIRLPDGTNAETHLKIGDKVVLDFSGGWVRINDELLISATARNVLAVLEEVPA